VAEQKDEAGKYHPIHKPKGWGSVSSKASFSAQQGSLPRPAGPVLVCVPDFAWQVAAKEVVIGLAAGT